MNRKNITLLVIILCFGFLSFAYGQEWTQWRGTNRDGVVKNFSVPQSWPESLNLKWKTEVGEGYSSPLTSNDLVFVVTRDDEEEVGSAIFLDNGEILAQRSYPISFTLNRAAASHGKGPKSTPIIYNNKIFTLGISGILSCFDIYNGDSLWQKDFSDKFKSTYPDFGTAMSPMVYKSSLIVHVGGNNQGELMALDVETGEKKWSWDGDGPGYASPIIAEFDGIKQIITQTQKHCVGIAADTGGLLWSIPFTTPYEQNIVTPILYKDMVIFSGIRNGAKAIRVIKQGDNWSTEQVWHNAGASMYMSSPVIKDDMLLGFSNERSGHFFCLNAQTGETLWQSEGQKGDNAALLIAGDVLLALMNDSNLVVIKAIPEKFEQIAQYKVADSQTWAHPVIFGKYILVKDNTNLYLWGLE